MHLIHAYSRLADVRLGDNIVAIKHGSGPVPGNLHRDALRNPASHHVANRRSAEVVEEFVVEPDPLADLVPQFLLNPCESFTSIVTDPRRSGISTARLVLCDALRLDW